jgi:hypothetical protein
MQKRNNIGVQTPCENTLTFRSGDVFKCQEPISPQGGGDRHTPANAGRFVFQQLVAPPRGRETTTFDRLSSAALLSVLTQAALTHLHTQARSTKTQTMRPCTLLQLESNNLAAHLRPCSSCPVAMKQIQKQTRNTEK